MKTFFILLTTATLVLTGCANSKKSVGNDSEQAKATELNWRDGFPAHWWKEVPREEAKSWENLPQDAGTMEVILSKRNELGLLSNFADTPFVFHGVCYPTVEAFWQMMKYPEGENDVRFAWAHPWKYSRLEVSQMDGYKAKSAGGYANFLMEKNKVNWVTFEGKRIPFVVKVPAEHYDLIWQALIEKVRQNPDVLKVLMQTDNLTLKPDHQIDPKSPREWHYNLLWMDIRAEIQKDSLPLKSSEDLSLRSCKAL